MKNLVGHKVKCNICPEMFSNETKLKINMDIQKFQIQMKPETQDKFECEICNRVFKTDHVVRFMQLRYTQVIMETILNVKHVTSYLSLTR